MIKMLLMKYKLKELGRVTFLPFYLFTLLPLANAQQLPVYLDESKPIEQRIDDALQRMTLDEKIAVIHAQSKFSSPGVKRLGFPDLWTDDGPHGVRPDVLWDEWEQAGATNDSCVAFPALTCLAATWQPELARRYGVALGVDERYFFVECQPGQQVVDAALYGLALVEVKRGDGCRRRQQRGYSQ